MAMHSHVGFLGEIFAIANMTICVIIFIYHLIITLSVFKFNRHKLNTKPKCLNSIYLSFPLFIFGYITLAALYTLTQPMKSDELCIFTQYTGFISYVVFKTILYYILVFRLYELFSKSMLAYDNKYLLLWSIFLTVWNFTNITLGFFFMNIYLDPDPNNPECVITFEIWFPALFTLIDVIACIGNAYLFYKPIYKLNQILQDDKESDGSLYWIAKKQCILSIITCLTTLITMICMGAFKDFELEPLFIGTDVNVSVISILLMYKWNNGVFKVICCLFVGHKETDSDQVEETQGQKESTSVDV